MVEATRHKTATDSAHSPRGRPEIPWSGLVHLCIVYLVWGSTYLAIRVAVREGTGFPPFTLGLTRVLLAGAVLLCWSGLSGHNMRLSRRELFVLGASGLLLWTGGNGAVIWAEQRLPSAYAAVLVGTTPIWVASLEALIDRRLPSLLLLSSLLLGLLGTTLLSYPALRSGGEGDLISVSALPLASLSWAAGSLLQNHYPVRLSARASAGYQQLFGSLGFLVLMLLSGEPAPTPTRAAWWAWGYLVVFGSILAFTSFVHALRSLPSGIVFTYAYVNPVIAVMLGWMFLNEPMTSWMIAGTTLVLLGVAGVFRDRARRERRAYH